MFDAVQAAESDAEKGEIVAAAIASGRFDGDNDALIGLLGLDPTIDAQAGAELIRQARDRADVDTLHGIVRDMLTADAQAAEEEVIQQVAEALKPAAPAHAIHR